MQILIVILGVFLIYAPSYTQVTYLPDGTGADVRMTFTIPAPPTVIEYVYAEENNLMENPEKIQRLIWF